MRLILVVGPAGDDAGTTDVLRQLGVDTGGVERSVAFRAFHDELLRAGGVPGAATPDPAPADGWHRSSDLDPLRDRAGRLVQDTSPGTDVAVVADARGTLVLPFWETVAGVEASVVVLGPPSLAGAEDRALRYVARFAATRVDLDLWKERAEAAEAEAERWEGDFHRLRNRRSVRAVLSVAGAFRPLLAGSKRDAT